MIKRAIASTALITALGFCPVDGVHAQTSGDQTQPAVDTMQKKPGEMARDCEAVDHKPGQQTIVEGKEDLSSASKEDSSSASTGKTAHEINKEIVAAMIEKKSGNSGDTKPQASGDNTAKEINKEIVSNTKETESGKVIAETGIKKPVENWFGCPPHKDKKN